MQLSHTPARCSASFDEPNLLVSAGHRSRRYAWPRWSALPDLATEHVTAGANPGAKVMSLVAGMAAGADSIDDLDVLRRAGRYGCSRGAGPVDAGHVPARVHVRACAAVGCGRRPDPVGLAHPSAAVVRHPDLPDRYRRHRQRVSMARVSRARSSATRRSAGSTPSWPSSAPGRRAGDRRDPAAPRAAPHPRARYG